VCEIKGYEFLWCDCNYMICTHMFYSVSSPYLLVFGDDCVRDIREQMMLQVDLVSRRVEAGLACEIFYSVILL